MFANYIDQNLMNNFPIEVFKNLKYQESQYRTDFDSGDLSKKVSTKYKLKAVHKIQKPKVPKRRYRPIIDDVRKQLIDAIKNNGEKIKDVAERLQINYSSAKSVVQVFNREGRFNKKVKPKKHASLSSEKKVNEAKDSQKSLLKTLRRAYRKKIASGVKENKNQKGVKATGGNSLLEPQNLAIKPADAISLHSTPFTQEKPPFPLFQQPQYPSQPQSNLLQYQNPVLNQAQPLTVRDNLISKGMSGKYQGLNSQLASQANQKQHSPRNMCYLSPNNFEGTSNIYVAPNLINNINFINPNSLVYHHPSQFYDVQNKIAQVESYPMKWHPAMHQYEVNQPMAQMPANYYMLENQMQQIHYPQMIQAAAPVYTMFNTY